MSKPLEYYMGLPYTLELQDTAEEGWQVRVRELPGCTSWGQTGPEALENVREAMQLWLEVALEDGLAIPEPRPEEAYSGKFLVRLPRSLHRELAERAEEEGTSLNQLVATALAHHLGRGRPAAQHG
ncbi:MAG: type II toxin-antitoxin system HicB family antitoxin [Candidatus Promineifilaceae bacterium]